MILIIDDNEDIRFTLKEICEFSEWPSMEAPNGKKGVEMLKALEPDLVLVDYHMPGWDGLKTVKEIRKHDKNIPIIVLTVEERQSVANNFLEAGATDFAMKPIKAPDLISRIKLNLKYAKLSHNDQEMFVEKGINKDTMKSIKQFLYEQENPVTINDIQAQLPIAYQTVHRYLHHMVEKGDVEVVSDYGSRGRPKNKYQLI
ncbi:response regulator [Thalassobacillus pellis]|uniref:response regulator n=1 Tax=Thalassobacillus pellis TaxID=748008 RepID=UPI001EF94A60|nr:response regulator [Thalassobacillus pellis]MBM7551361.1 two-component system response regulator DctR [Thalassobacillus pellis]